MVSILKKTSKIPKQSVYWPLTFGNLICSSGYGSEAVSSSNLTNDDTLSLKSISDDTPDQNTRPMSASQSFETKCTQSSETKLLPSDDSNKIVVNPARDRRKSSSEMPETFNTLAFNSPDATPNMSELSKYCEERQNPFNKNFTIHAVNKTSPVQSADPLPTVTVTGDLQPAPCEDKVDMKSSMSSSLTISSDMASSLTVSSEMDSCSDFDKRSSSSSLSSHDDTKVSDLGILSLNNITVVPHSSKILKFSVHVVIMKNKAVKFNYKGNFVLNPNQS